MTLGTGIFLAALFLGIVYLYINTRDRWDWKKIAKRFFLGIIALILVLVVGAGVTDLYNYLTQDKDLSAKNEDVGLVTTLEKISLGEKISDIEFKLAVKNITPKSDKADEAEYQLSNEPRLKFYVDKTSKLVSRVYFVCDKDSTAYPNLYSFNIHGVKCGASSETISSIYKPKNIRVLCYFKEEGNDDSIVNSVRSYDIPKYGLRYILDTNTVVAVLVASPEKIESSLGKHWKTCK